MKQLKASYSALVVARKALLFCLVEHYKEEETRYDEDEGDSDTGGEEDESDEEDDYYESKKEVFYAGVQLMNEDSGHLYEPKEATRTHRTTCYKCDTGFESGDHFALDYSKGILHARLCEECVSLRSSELLRATSNLLQYQRDKKKSCTPSGLYHRTIRNERRVISNKLIQEVSDGNRPRKSGRSSSQLQGIRHPTKSRASIISKWYHETIHSERRVNSSELISGGKRPRNSGNYPISLQDNRCY